MAPVIWGLDLAEIKWSKFKSSYMWNSDYHLRKTKFVVYQCALIFCVVSESLGTAALSGESLTKTFIPPLHLTNKLVQTTSTPKISFDASTNECMYTTGRKAPHFLSETPANPSALRFQIRLQQ